MEGHSLKVWYDTDMKEEMGGSVDRQREQEQGQS